MYSLFHMTFAVSHWFGIIFFTKIKPMHIKVSHQVLIAAGLTLIEMYRPSLLHERLIRCPFGRQCYDLDWARQAGF
jgi:hypothetical protein